MVATLAAWADFTLSATPVEGGSSLRFGRVSSSDSTVREVRLRISSTTGKQYQIRQCLVDRVINEKGAVVSNAVSTYTLRGSNAKGTLYQDIPAVLTSANQVIYSSNRAGDTDSMIVVYKIDPNAITSSGSFSGRICYTLTPQGTDAQKQVYLNLYFDAQNGFTFTSEPARELRLSTGNPKDMNAEIVFSTQGYVDGEYTITQQPQSRLMNQEGDFVDQDLIRFSVYAQNGVSEVVTPMVLTDKVEKIYTAGRAINEDKIAVKFVIDEKVAEKMSAGIYRAVIGYNVEAQGTVIARLNINVVIDIKRVFELQILADSRGTIMFEKTNPDASEYTEKKAVIRVRSNIDKPYYVVQKVPSPMANERGESIPTDDFSFKLAMADGQKGSLAYATSVKAKVGDTAIFNSDFLGTPAEFEITYILKPTRLYKAGDYRMNVSYALMEK